MRTLFASLLSIAAITGNAGAEMLARVEQAPDAARLRDLRQRAASGDADALFRLGEAYREGRGVAADIRAAEDFYRRAADAGHELAADEYGLLLFRTGRPHDAMPWIVKSAERGDARAQYVYGTALFNGDYVGKDWVKAYAMMSRAAASGIDAARNSLAQMNRYIPVDQRRAGGTLANAEPVRPATPSPVRTASAPARPVQLASRALLPPPEPIRMASVAPAPPPKSIAVPGGKWQVQLGAFGDEAKARALWTQAAAKLPALAGLQPRFVPAGALTRLRAGPLADRAAAEKLCAAAQARSQPCFPVAP